MGVQEDRVPRRAVPATGIRERDTSITNRASKCTMCQWEIGLLSGLRHALCETRDHERPE